MLEAARALGKRRGPEVEEGVELENVDGNGGGEVWGDSRVCWISLKSGAKSKANDHSRNSCPPSPGVWGHARIERVLTGFQSQSPELG